MDAIAARTHTTRALINYYFGGKEKVLLGGPRARICGDPSSRKPARPRPLAPVDAIRRIVQFTFDYYLGHEGFVRLVVAENQAKGRHFRKSKAMRSLKSAGHRNPGARHRTRAGRRSLPRRRGSVEIHKIMAALGMFNVTNQYTFGGNISTRHGNQGRRRSATRDGRRSDPQLLRKV